MCVITPTILAVSALATTAVGTGLSIYSANQRASYEKNAARAQERQEALRRRQMELANRRSQIEALRRAQRAQSLALATSTNQGALFGSALPGSRGQISGDSGNDLLGLSQSLALGNANFDLSADITRQRYGMASANALYNTGQGLTSLGNSLVNSMGPLGRLSQGFGSSAIPSLNFYPSDDI